MSSEPVKAFGREVRRRRLGLNMSLDTLSEAAGLSRNYLGEVEMGTRRPRGLSLDAAFRIAKGLDVELSELLGFGELPGVGVEAGRLVSQLKPKMRVTVLALLRGLAVATDGAG
ncbi:MAG: helix-turn-helix domain-containing protein [Polyangiaceae bacterium]|nr:helix-turn-helix domain-containing protein [Polyangiaceae bacterium]